MRGPMGRGPMPTREGPRGGGPEARMRTMAMGEKPKNIKETLLKLLKYIGNNKAILITLIVLMLLITLLSLYQPLLQARAIDTITINDNRPSVDFNALIKTLLTMLGAYIISAIMSYGQGILAALLSQKTVKKMRFDLFSKISKLSIRFFDTHHHGDIMSRMTNDVENISNTISQSIASLISGIITVIGTVIIMLTLSPKLTLISIITIFMSVFTTMFLSKYMRKYFPRQQKLLGEINSIAEETVSGYKTVIAYNKQSKSIEELKETGLKLRKTGIIAQMLGGIMGPLMNFINNLNFLLIAAFGAYFVIGGQISVGIISAFITYSKQFSRPINEIATQYAQIQTAIAGAERVFEIMDKEPETDNGTESFDGNEVKGNIDFENIDFSYVEGEPVLKDFSLSVKAGQKIAIVGATGSGKTTIVNLLTRFYDADSGSIKIDGKDILSVPKDTLRNTIGIVLQDSTIFSDTVKNNILFGKLDATDAEIEKAANIANVSDFVRLFKDGYDTMLTEQGNNLSQGQRQLISIARAVLRDPKILILDEATSNIDTRTELHIQEAMINLMENRTSLIIAHRLSTIRTADMIIVIDNGQIVEKGNHNDLISKKGKYFELYNSQFAGLKT